MQNEVSTKFILETIQEFNKREIEINILEAVRPSQILGTTIYRSKYVPKTSGEPTEEPQAREDKKPEDTPVESSKPSDAVQDELHKKDLNKYYADKGTDSVKEIWRLLSESLINRGYSKTAVGGLLPEFEKIIQGKIQGNGDLNKVKDLIPGEITSTTEISKETPKQEKKPSGNIRWSPGFSEEDKENIKDQSNVWSDYYLREVLVNEREWVEGINSKNPDTLVNIVNSDESEDTIPGIILYINYNAHKVYSITNNGESSNLIMMVPEGGSAIKVKILDKVIPNHKDDIIFKREEEVGKGKDRKKQYFIGLTKLSLIDKNISPEFTDILKRLGAKEITKPPTFKKEPEAE